MNTPLPIVLGGHSPATAAVYLADYLQKLNVWPTSPKFSRESFILWLANDTRANGAYGCDYVLGGLDELVSNGFITTDSTSLEMTPAFVDIMQQYV
jgi:hypothetical protein